MRQGSVRSSVGGYLLCSLLCFLRECQPGVGSSGWASGHYAALYKDCLLAVFAARVRPWGVPGAHEPGRAAAWPSSRCRLRMGWARVPNGGGISPSAAALSRAARPDARRRVSRMPGGRGAHGRALSLPAGGRGTGLHSSMPGEPPFGAPLGAPHSAEKSSSPPGRPGIQYFNVLLRGGTLAFSQCKGNTLFSICQVFLIKILMIYCIMLIYSNI